MLAFFILSCWALRRKSKEKNQHWSGLRARHTNSGTPVQKAHLTNPLTHWLEASSNQSPGAQGKEIIKFYLCIIDLSYSSPSGVFMMANSSRVTWHRAGFSIDAEIVLMSCGSTLPGESRERDPTAFIDDYQENKGKNIKFYSLVQWVLESYVEFYSVAGTHSYALKSQLLFTRDILFESAFSPPFGSICFLIDQLTLNSSRKFSCSKISPKTNTRQAEVYHLVLQSVGCDPG